MFYNQIDHFQRYFLAYSKPFQNLTFSAFGFDECFSILKVETADSRYKSNRYLHIQNQQ